VTTALSLSIRPKLAVECPLRSNQQGVGHFVQNLGVFPLEYIRDVGVWSAQCEQPRLTNSEIMSEEFQLM